MNKTIGQLSQDLLQKDIEKVLISEKTQEMQQDYLKELFISIDRGFLKYPNDFYIEVQTKREPLMPNVMRNYFVDRKTCPTPNYDQSVFRYNRAKSSVEYLWSLPDRDSAHYLKDNKNIVDKSEHELLQFVMLMDNGKLLSLSKKLNGEVELPGSSLKVK